MTTEELFNKLFKPLTPEIINEIINEAVENAKIAVQEDFLSKVNPNVE